MKQLTPIVASMLWLLAGCAGNEPAGPCVGPSTASAADSQTSETATDTAQAGDGATSPPCVNCPGGLLPTVAAMTDAQPDSCRYGESYELSAFRGRTTVVALLAAW